MKAWKSRQGTVLAGAEVLRYSGARLVIISDDLEISRMDRVCHMAQLNQQARPGRVQYLFDPSCNVCQNVGRHYKPKFSLSSTTSQNLAKYCDGCTSMSTAVFGKPEASRMCHSLD